MAKMGDKMNYTVAVAEPGGFSDTYMSDVEVEGQQQPIPYAFVVDRNGIVAWEGSHCHRAGNRRGIGSRGEGNERPGTFKETLF